MSSNGKILIYAPNNPGDFGGVKNIENAASKIAKRLKLGLEIIQRTDLNSVSVYFESCDGQLIPVYFNYWPDRPEEEVYMKIRNMIFVLSFHPRFDSLRPIRREIMEPS